MAETDAGRGKDHARPAADRLVEPQSSGYARYVLAVLFIVYVINFIDRQVLSVFIGPIKAEFGVSDSAMGFLIGFAFALFYTFAGIPIARWADRGNRRTVISVGLALWSGMTLASGLARNFTQLALARVGVGVGEAAGSPPAHSLISDYFPPQRRATALGIYAWGVYIGSALAYLFGGYLREHFDWRTAFYLLGAPGLFFALVVRFSVREPPRGMSEQAAGQVAQTTLGETLRHLLTCRSWLNLMLGASLLSITGYGVLMWGYEFYGRVHELPFVEIGVSMALIVGLGGSLGTLAGGTVCDRLGRRDPGWYMRLPAIVSLASVPLGAAFLLARDSTLSLALFFPFYLLANFYVPSLHSVNQNLAKLRMRATAAAIMLFVVNIVGAGAGPLIVGILNDAFSTRYGDEAIRYSLLTLSMTSVMGSLFLYLSSRTLAADLERTRE